MKVQVLSGQLIYTDYEKNRYDYVEGDVFDMHDDFAPGQIEAGNVKAVEASTPTSDPKGREKVRILQPSVGKPVHQQ